MKKILLIATGGTIASKYTQEGLSPQISADELLEYIPAAAEFCTIDTVQPFSLDSTNICAPHWLQLARLIEKKYEFYDGFVICHGTDTMAYTAAALSYLIQNNRRPIVITGAQKPIDLAITDARSNLLDSLRFASHDRAHGVSIVFGGKVIAGTRAKKEFSKSYNAFSSINYPDIASIHDDRIIFYIDDKDHSTKPLKFYHEMNERIFLLKLIPGIDGKVLDALFASYDGLIIESFGVGGLPSYGNDRFLEALDHWVSAGKPVCMATQVTHEGSDMDVYQVGKVIKERFPVLESYDMTLEASVTKMMWALAQSKDMSKCRELFYMTVNHDLLFV
ncbi:asparaginase [Ruminococcus sp. 5_1_39BFAA]|uniref:asparaginase n=1 Tax=Ruminococcus sp. 5_1_39BFAA TaxID=457412 RepID=UPI00356AC96E